MTLPPKTQFYLVWFGLVDTHLYSALGGIPSSYHMHFTIAAAKGQPLFCVTPV